MEKFIEKYFLYLYANDKCYSTEYGSIGKHENCIDTKYRIIVDNEHIKIIPACIKTNIPEYYDTYIYKKFLIPDEHLRCGELGIWLFSDKESDMTLLLKPPIFPVSTCIVS